MKFIGNKVAIKKIPDPETTREGLYLGGKRMDYPDKGIVISCPDEYIEQGVLRKSPCKVGDVVLFIGSAAVQLKIEDEELHIAMFDNIICVLDKSSCVAGATINGNCCKEANIVQNGELIKEEKTPNVLEFNKPICKE